MSKVWDVSVKLGVDGEPHEKELAGELALGLALLLFELGNEVLAVLRLLQRWAATMTGHQPTVAMAGVLSASAPPYSAQFIKGVLAVLAATPSLEVLHIHVECKAHICAFLKHIQDRDEEYRLEPLHQKVLADLRQMTWSS